MNTTPVKPLVIAHRGASAYEPENTLRAFELAIEQGAEMIELDLHMTADDQVVVIHDETLDHTTNLTGRVRSLTLDQVKLADAGKGEKVPTLDETLDLCSGRARLYLEIKDPAAAAATLHAIRNRRLQDQILIASFDLELMESLGKEVDDIGLGLILGTRSLNPVIRWRETFPWIAFRSFRYQVISIEVDLCHAFLAKKVKADGKTLFVWTADEKEQFHRMLSHRVDGIVTNRPDHLTQFLQDLPQRHFESF
jgi:glycerophosphoryl diester phosphodiesterase